MSDETLTDQIRQATAWYWRTVMRHPDRTLHMSLPACTLHRFLYDTMRETPSARADLVYTLDKSDINQIINTWSVAHDVWLTFSDHTGCQWGECPENRGQVKLDITHVYQTGLLSDWEEDTEEIVTYWGGPDRLSDSGVTDYDEPRYYGGY